MSQITNAAQTEAQQGNEKLQKINDQFHWCGPPSALPALLCPTDGHENTGSSRIRREEMKAALL